MTTSALQARKDNKTAKTPAADCGLCPRLAEFRHGNQKKFPDKHNAPVPAFGGLDAQFLVVGLAPGLKGANFSGRPFTGDYAGDLLYEALKHFDFAKGTYGRTADDGFTLQNCRITNAVRCVPPQNKPTPEEIRTCMPFLTDEIAAMKNLKVILALGTIAHQAVLRSFGLKISDYPFGHARETRLPVDNAPMLIDSYHCSRYNTQTKRLTREMFFAVIERARKIVG